MAARQILLPLEGGHSDRFEDFASGDGGTAVAALHELLRSPGSVLYLHGPVGSGKSLLLKATCNAAREQGLRAFYLALQGQPDAVMASLADLSATDLLCLDDIDAVAGRATWEAALFHGFNQLRAAGGRLVASASAPLAAQRFSLPDLVSRLGWGTQVRLEPLDDEQKAGVLQRRALALGFELPVEVQAYLLSRGPRNLGTLLGLLGAIHSAALAGKRRITVPLAREVLSAAVRA